MSSKPIKEHFNLNGTFFVNNIITILFDLITLFVWAYSQYIFQSWEPVILDKIDTYTITVFKIVFFISTLCPVLITMYKHIRIMINRANKEIRKTE